MTLCGIPSITLEGSKQDWEKLLLRLEKLPSFGNEPSQWAALLRPILQRFVQTFDVVQAESALNTEAHEELKEFYTKVASQYSFGSGTGYLSGWITAFCVWDADGKWQGSRLSGSAMRLGIQRSHPEVFIEGLRYPNIESSNVPMGFCLVDEVKVVEPEGETICSMVAGHMANVVEGEEKDTLRPLGCWFIFEKLIGESVTSESAPNPRHTIQRKLKSALSDSSSHAKDAPVALENTSTSKPTIQAKLKNLLSDQPSQPLDAAVSESSPRPRRTIQLKLKNLFSR